MTGTLAYLDDFEREAKKKVAKKYWLAISSGTDEQITLIENRQAFRRLMLRPRVLRHYKDSVDVSTTVLGQPVAFPVGTAPSVSQKWFHPEGDICTARAAAEAGTPFITGMRASTSIEDIASGSPHGMKWLQIVPFRDRAFTEKLLKRAEEAGFKAVVWTVNGSLPNRKRNGETRAFEAIKEVESPNLVAITDPASVENVQEKAQTWGILHWLRTVTKLPIIIKGIQHPKDALLAVEHGASAIIVSNIGGRSLDCVPAAVDTLPDIVKAVDGKVEIYVDGGVRTGTDVLKCLALGARCVFIGRPVLWGLACNGQAGVKKVLDILKDELWRAMYFSGCSSIADIPSDLVIKKYYYANL